MPVIRAPAPVRTEKCGESQKADTVLFYEQDDFESRTFCGRSMRDLVMLRLGQLMDAQYGDSLN